MNRASLLLKRRPTSYCGVLKCLPTTNALCALALGIVIAAAGASAQQPDPLAQLAERIEQSLAPLNLDVLAVTPFTYADGINSIEGAITSDRLVELLAQRGAIRIVERQKLDKITDEQKLALSGLIEASGAARVGKLLGARAILTGTTTDLGDNLDVRARLISVETAEIIATLSQTIPRAIKTFISPLWEEIARIKKENPSFNIRLWTDRSHAANAVPRYRIGETLTLYFEADRDCHVTIFDFTTSGSIYVLFPNSFMPDNKIKAHHAYAVPDAQAGFKIRVGDPPGIEKLKVFATTTNVPLFRHDYALESFRSLSQKDYSVSRDLLPIVNSLDDNAWAESSLELLIEQTLRGDS